MTRSWRWWLAAVAVVLVIGVPAVVRALPVGAAASSAAQVLAGIRAAEQHPYSGRVEMTGNLDLPVTSHFTDIGELLGERTSLRVWWRGPDEWRVDKLLVAGEDDLVRDGGLTTRWRYEGSRVVRSVDPEVRLPRSADLLPTTLAARVVEDADRASVSRIGALRIAGVAAPGVRIVPGDARSSVGHVDLWADPRSGVVLRVEVYAAGDSAPSFTTAFTSFSADAPASARTRFVPPAGADVSFDNVLDIADAANQYAPFEPPSRVAGLARAATPHGAVGVYGSGLTRLLAIPLRHHDAETLRDQVRRSAGATRTDAGVSLEVGPLGVLVAEHQEGSWLVTGLVTQETLVEAAADLTAGTRAR